ncbi:helix-turn-helix domain-containing protein, partial [Streptomyces sp. NPDC002589]|uniref:helix-turn-helix domain-containing protein n=1 Tax=Streptomyces sp. NPDC002589 TaxID=3154420 RepID=UPI00331B29D0
LERAAAMLRLLAGGERRLGLSDIASSLGLAKQRRRHTQLDGERRCRGRRSGPGCWSGWPTWLQAPFAPLRRPAEREEQALVCGVAVGGLELIEAELLRLRLEPLGRGSREEQQTGAAGRTVVTRSRAGGATRRPLRASRWRSEKAWTRDPTLSGLGGGPTGAGGAIGIRDRNPGQHRTARRTGLQRQLGREGHLDP